MVDPRSADLYEVMEVAWPSGDALRGESPNHPPVPWLKTVVLNGAGKVGTGSRQVWTGEMGDGRELASAVRSAERCSAGIRTRACTMSWDESGGYPFTAQAVPGV